METFKITNKLVKQLENARSKRLVWVYWSRKSKEKCSRWIDRLLLWQTKSNNNTKIFCVTLFLLIVSTVLKMARRSKSYVITWEKCTNVWEFFLIKVIEALLNKEDTHNELTFVCFISFIGLIGIFLIFLCKIFISFWYFSNKSHVKYKNNITIFIFDIKWNLLNLKLSSTSKIA